MDAIRLSVDTGLFILVWLVQVIIYPSFAHIAKEKLSFWHRLYTQKILYFVGPLMFVQTGLISWQILGDPLVYFADGLLLAGIWINTFLIAIPIHADIDRDDILDSHLPKLLRVNGWRSWMWTGLFLISLGRVLV
ncbi:MAG: hypothetical protein MUE75_03195 [Algoriphagus sp.]|jgi:hypothetical protein|nr:hypothetical protein [Algoriphagus sp.]